MVCDRCKMVVAAELENLGFHPLTVELGEVELAEELEDSDKDRVNARIVPLGFELIDSRKGRLIERIKTRVVDLVHYSDGSRAVNLSDYLVQYIPMEYNYLSSLFSEMEGTTIEKFYIAQKIERVKELLEYDELSLSEIADQMGYSSVAYLSTQFKKIAGITPSQFRKIRAEKRKSLDQL